MKAIAQQIEKAASPKDVRQYLRAPYFDGKRVIATDGHILAIVKAEKCGEHDDDKGHVPAEILKAARKKGGNLRLNGKAETAGLAMDRPDLGDFIKPNGIARIVRGASKNKAMVIALDAGLLLRLAQSINPAGHKFGDIVCLHIENGESAVFVKGQDPKAYGVIMPVRR